LVRNIDQAHAAIWERWGKVVEREREDDEWAPQSGTVDIEYRYKEWMSAEKFTVKRRIRMTKDRIFFLRIHFEDDECE
jgi:hypothetical protein